MMLSQHSLFLPTLLTSEDEENPDNEVKGDPPAPTLPFQIEILFSDFVELVVH